jgi:2-polyprenyl-3-methyl-5-hydroxy-6-metoxy-1,4-benzoquinol methylase
MQGQTASASTGLRDALARRLLEANLATYELATIYLGDRLGLYKALREGGPATPGELARRTGTAERYVREWLEQQAVAGFIEVSQNDAKAADRTYALGREHAEVLLDRDSLSYIAPLGRFTIGVLAGLPKLLEAFRSSGGISYAAYNNDVREGQAEVNRTMFINLLGSQWLPSIPDVHRRLMADPRARVADIACGTGWSSIAIARAYPKARVDGFDSDEQSIEMARENAEAEGLDGRINFLRRDAADPKLRRKYDLVTIFEALHDMARPVEALKAARSVVNEDGAVLVADERVGHEFTPGNSDERLFYSWSVLFCLPTGMAEQPSAGTGTVMRPDKLRQYASEAGFANVEILPIEHEFWRFYRLSG